MHGCEDDIPIEFELSYDLRCVATAARTEFAIWASQNKKWIDFFFKHALSNSVMGDILAITNAPHKSWKTITVRLRED